jgi:hypothetical protein
LADELTEMQAWTLEAELIAAFGTEITGGILTNSVQPSGILRSVRNDVVIPLGIRDKAQLGLRMLKEAVLELAPGKQQGRRHSEDSQKDVGEVRHLRPSLAIGSQCQPWAVHLLLICVRLLNSAFIPFGDTSIWPQLSGLLLFSPTTIGLQRPTNSGY